MNELIRQASKADILILETIHALAFPRPEAWSRDVFDLQLEMPNVVGLIHQEGGLILLRHVADEADILTLAVVPEVRRKGIAQTLLGKATTVAASLGVHTVFLEVSVANIAARELYTRIGFVQVGRRRLYYSDRSDALVLRLDLIPPHDDR
jgi:[ribosomal protein S18]-alanine N-acetyltransferase